MHTDLLLDKYTIISDQIETKELRVLLCELEKLNQQNVEGAVVEFGCYSGTTSLFIRRLLDAQKSREFHVYDSFEGLPEKTEQDSSPAGMQFKPGELSVSKATFLHNFKKANLRPPIVHKNWFRNLTAADVPAGIAFAFLDGDYYESIKDPLKLIWSKLVPGAVVIVDDYQNEALPGAAKATNEWIKAHPVTKFRVEQSLAVMKLN